MVGVSGNGTAVGNPAGSEKNVTFYTYGREQIASYGMDGCTRYLHDVRESVVQTLTEEAVSILPLYTLWQLCGGKKGQPGRADTGITRNAMMQ